MLIGPHDVKLTSSTKGQARVVQRMDNAIHQINHYPADSVVCFVNTYPLDKNRAHIQQ